LKKFLTEEGNWSSNQSNASRQVLKTIGGN